MRKSRFTSRIFSIDVVPEVHVAEVVRRSYAGVVSLVQRFGEDVIY